MVEENCVSELCNVSCKVSNNSVLKDHVLGRLKCPPPFRIFEIVVKYWIVLYMEKNLYRLLSTFCKCES